MTAGWPVTYNNAAHTYAHDTRGKAGDNAPPHHPLLLCTSLPYTYPSLQQQRLESGGGLQAQWAGRTILYSRTRFHGVGLPVKQHLSPS